MATEQTLLMIKPDAIARGAVGQIIGRLEAEGFALRQLRMVRLDRDQAERFYAVHRGRPFFAGLVEFMPSGPAIPIVLERDNAVAHLRGFIGVTDSAKAAAGTIRRDFGTDVQRNAVHASDCLENAAREAAFFFGAGGG
jgi:nucleoside-diphosphate kinase